MKELVLNFAIAYGIRLDEFPIYVGPGDDPDTEELRRVFRMLSDLSPAVPEDPKEGGELLMLSLAFARHLEVISLVATERYAMKPFGVFTFGAGRGEALVDTCIRHCFQLG